MASRTRSTGKKPRPMLGLVRHAAAQYKSGGHFDFSGSTGDGSLYASPSWMEKILSGETSSASLFRLMLNFSTALGSSSWPLAVVGSAHSIAAIWNVSMQSPRFGRSALLTISQALLHVGAAVDQLTNSYAMRCPSGSSMSASSPRSSATKSRSVSAEGDAFVATCVATCVRWTET